MSSKSMKSPDGKRSSPGTLLPRIAVAVLVFATAGGSFSCKEKGANANSDRKRSAREQAGNRSHKDETPALESAGIASDAEKNRSSAELKPDSLQSAAGDLKRDEAARLLGSADWSEKRLDFYREWAETAPEEAIGHARTKNPGASTACVSSVLEGWMAKDPSAALAWVGGEPANAEKSIWTSKLASLWPEDRLEVLAAPVAAMAEAPGGQIVVDLYSQRLMAGDPMKAFSWMHDSITDPVVSAKSVSTVMRSWSARETEKASGWLAEIPASEPWKDDAIAGLVRGVASLDPEAARQWAGSIGGVALRNETLEWLNAHPATGAAGP